MFPDLLPPLTMAIRQPKNENGLERTPMFF
jgi:hypothetical protein